MLLNKSVIPLARKNLVTDKCNKFLFRCRMYGSNEATKIAIVQMQITANKLTNFATVSQYVTKASRQHASMVFLPKATDYVKNSKSVAQNYLNMSENIDGETVESYCNLAKKCNVWLSVGGLHLRESSATISINHLIIDNKGKIVEKYMNPHLFHAPSTSSKAQMAEFRLTEFGKGFSLPIETPCGSLSLGIGDDLIFPEMSLLQRRAGAHILTFPSGFRTSIGKAQWLTLLKARAIESQCYVVAAAQAGESIPKKHMPFGHSLVIDPRGIVIAESENSVALLTARIDISLLKRIRRNAPILRQRRSTLYSLCRMTRTNEAWPVELVSLPSHYCQYQFGHVFIPSSCVVLKTYSSYVSVNKKPIAENHLLVISDRPAESLIDLDLSEICDLAQTFFLSFALLRFAKKNDFQIGIQDGSFSGQTIKHVHVHIVPIENNDLSLQGHEEADRPCRDQLDMQQEAYALKAIAEEVIMDKIESFLDSPPKKIELGHSTETSWKFRKCELTADYLLCHSNMLIAFPAPMPVLEGHTIIVFHATTTNNFENLNAKEVSELFQFFQIVEKNLLKCFQTSSATISANILNKNNLMQTMFHIIPRQKDDLQENDQIYKLVRNYEDGIKELLKGQQYNQQKLPEWTKEFKRNIE